MEKQLALLNKQQEIIALLAEMQRELISELSQYKSVEIEEKRLEEVLAQC